MWWGLTHRYRRLGGTWHFHLQGWKERTFISWRGGQQVPPNCLGLSTKPHGVTFHDFILNKLQSPLHITFLGLIYMSTRVFKLHIKFLKRYTVQFHPSQNTWQCPPSEPVQHCEFIAVVCSGVTLTGGFGYKWCWQLLWKWNYSLLQYVKWLCSTALLQTLNKLSCLSAALCHNTF